MVLTLGITLHRGDIHHVFPRSYLKKYGLTRGSYNQIANYVYMQSEINIRVGKKAPHIYFDELQQQCRDGEVKYGGIRDTETLKDNLRMNCVPEDVFTMAIDDYENFLVRRRVLVAQKIRDYYFAL